MIQEIAGKTFHVVNPLPEETMETLVKAVICYEEEMQRETEVCDIFDENNPIKALEKEFNSIASGHCGVVYDLGEYIMKVAKPWVQEEFDNGTRDGLILHELQGIPMIPTIYAYCEDNSFMVIQKIKGTTVCDLRMQGNFKPKNWNSQEQYELLDKANNEIMARGWNMADLHGENCMIDEDGKFWLIDVGLFYKHGEYEFGRGYQTARRSIDQVERVLMSEQLRKDREVKEQQNKPFKLSFKGSHFSVRMEAIPVVRSPYDFSLPPYGYYLSDYY